MIPVNEPLLAGKELEYVTECLTSGWISSEGRFIEEFESAWAAYCGVAYGVAVCNGTAALDVAVECLDLEPGDEVIMPSFTIISCARAVVRHGGVPVLVDCEADTWCMSVDQVESKVTGRTRAVMPVHIYGHPVDMDPIQEIADRHGLTILEDAAEAHGAQYKDRVAGSLGHLACFSFYANKIVTTGEGGMVMTDLADMAERARAARNLYFERERRFWHTRLGENYRMTNVQAAIGVAQVERVEQTVERKRLIGKRYTDGLAGIRGLQLPVEKSWARNVYWMYGIVVGEETGLSGSRLTDMLAERGVMTRPFFVGMHEQPVLLARGLFQGESYPVTETLSRQGLYLPSGTALSDEDLDAVCVALREVLPQ